MMTQSTIERLATVIRSHFKLPQAVINTETTADDIMGWDSLSHATLLMKIEQAFNIIFVPAEVLNLETVGDLALIIDRRLAGESNA